MIGCTCEVCSSNDVKDKRLRSSILVNSNVTSFVIDTTPDFRYQMLREEVMSLDAVLYTHLHKDHIAGLDDIRAYNFFSQKPMEIYASLATQEALRREFSYIFTDKKYPGIPKVNLNLIAENRFMVGDIEVIPIKVMHLHMPVLGFRIGEFTYITDANYISELEMEKIIGSKVVVLNALRKEKHISHFSLSEAEAVANHLEVEQTYLTHISHQLGKHSVVNAELPSNIQLAYDGLKIVF